MRWPFAADGVNDLEDEAAAIFEAAAVSICAVIGNGGEKLMEEIAVRGMDFNEVKAGGEGAMS